jgi:hypothetical protein
MIGKIPTTIPSPKGRDDGLEDEVVERK